MPRPLLLLASWIALCLFGATPAGAVLLDQPESGAPPSTASPDRVIVQWLPGADHGDRVDARAEADVSFRSDLGNREFQLVEVEAGQTPGAAVAALEADPAVAVAERDGYRNLDGIPNDPLFNQLWGLRNLGTGINGFSGAVAGDDANLPAAWDRTVGTPSTVIADIDSGYRFDDPDLGPVAWVNPGEIAGNGIDDDGNGYADDVHGYDFVGSSTASPTSDNNPTDDNLISGGHGLHTAGTMGAAGNNGVGISGVARNVRIMPLRVCSNTPSNTDSCPFSSILAAINYAGENGARVANMSLGGNTFTQTEVNAIAAHPNTLYVISAGNDGSNNDGGEAAPKGHHYPCDYRPTVDASPPVAGAIDNIICVAATDQADGLASFSDYGATSVDIGAPGTQTLSTYPKQNTLLSDNFETGDFETEWLAYGAGFGRAGAGDGPLTSFGMTDTPGAPPTANSVYGVLSGEVTTVVAGTGSCRIKGMRLRKGGSMFYGLFLDGSSAGAKEFSGGETVGTGMVSFQTVPILGLSGHWVEMFFEYGSDSTPVASEGLWLDELSLQCYAPLSTPLSYEFLQGTSMAAPHVTGAAALLFSLKPNATVTEVRQALLSSADPVASLSAKTTSGGRLDVAAALEALVPLGSETVVPDTEITGGPPASTTSTTASFQFRRLDADGGSFECKLDSGPFSTCASGDGATVGLGAHQFQVRAKGVNAIVDPTPASVSWTVTQTPPAPSGNEPGGGSPNPVPPEPASCKVPKLAGLSLAKAKSALKAAGCVLGKVTKPKTRKGVMAAMLVVKSSTPGAGASTTGPVALKLGPKPKKHSH